MIMYTGQNIVRLAYGDRLIRPKSPGANTLAYYKMDGNANDSSGNGNNGTATNVTWVDGILGSGAASFNGSSSIITCPSTSIRPTGSFTINAIINMATTGTYKSIFQTYSQLTPTVAGFKLLINNSNRLQIVSGKNTGYTLNTDYKELGGSTTLSANTVYMVTGVYTGSQLLLYVNGVLDGSVSWANAAVYKSDCKPTIGANNYQSALIIDYFSGWIDEVKIYDRELTAGEISAQAAAYGF